MSQNKLNFTFDRLKRLVHDGSAKRLLLHDTTQPGLAICITPTGAKSFQLHYWDKMRRRSVVMTLGKFPAMSFVEARRKAREYIVDIDNGIDVKEKLKSVKEEDRFADVFSDWLEKHAKPHKRSWGEDQRRFDLYMKKQFGNKPISWFTPERVRSWHNGITKMPKQRAGETIHLDHSGKKSKTISYIKGTTANRALALLSTVFNQMRPFSPNPCKGIKKFSENSRSRFLQPNELKRFFKALDAPETPEIIRDFIYISLFTGARRDNVLSMQWKEIDADNNAWKIPARKSKNGEEMVIPLTSDCMEILNRRKRNTSSVFVFPSTSNRKSKSGRLVEPRRPWKDLLERSQIEDLRLHDLRRTLGSYQTITGASTAIVGRTLGHKSPEATAVYARLNLDPVRASVENATAAMLALKSPAVKLIDFDKKKKTI